MKAGDSLGDRMKAYEDCYRLYMPERLPVIVRVDGKAFHTLTRHLDKPFDKRFRNAMNSAAVALCTHMQGAQHAYVQSDEISVLLYPWQSNESQAWYGNNLQKISSVAASIAAVTFSRELNAALDVKVDGFFDGRSFVLPECEVENYFIWRQNDAWRNSVMGVAQANFSQKQLHGKSCVAALEMLKEHNVDVAGKYQPETWYGYTINKAISVNGWSWLVKEATDFKTPQQREYLRFCVGIKTEE